MVSQLTFFTVCSAPIFINLHKPMLALRGTPGHQVQVVMLQQHGQAQYTCCMPFVHFEARMHNPLAWQSRRMANCSTCTPSHRMEP